MDTRGQTLTHGIIQARLIRDISTFSCGVNLIKQINGLIARRAIGKRTKVKIAAVFSGTRNFKERVIVLFQCNIGVMAIIHKHDVVTRIMRLNEIHLQNKRFFIAIHDNEIEMIHMGNHGRYLSRLWP